MLAKLYSGAVVGLESLLVEVEVDVASQGLPSVTIVGLASKAVDEARQRVRAALKNSQVDFPSRRITINLAPADLPKEGSVYDLPIALAIMLASGQLVSAFDKAMFFGELSLDGSLRPNRGALPLVLLAKANNFDSVYLPEENIPEVDIISGIKIFPVKTLSQILKHLLKIEPIDPIKTRAFASLSSKTEAEFDFADVKGQQHVKRVLEIAAAGGHNVFMHGPPGSGKTMMARSLVGILPSLTESEAIEATNIYSVTGNLPGNRGLIVQRPFRSPHHTTSRIGLIGGGSRPMPGEISLAHRGVLFLDEFPEFPRNVLESLRQPLEDGVVTVSRAAGVVEFPAKFILIAAANPCPCGNLGSSKRECVCLPSLIQRYQKRISGPILDRIDIHVEVPEIEIGELVVTKEAEKSVEIRKRVQQARDLQQVRFKDLGYYSNAEISTKLVRKFCIPTDPAQKLLISAASKLGLSGRSYNKILKVSRTIADLVNQEVITPEHISEALRYRPQLGEN